jgi:hypothetical protein
MTMAYRSLISLAPLKRAKGDLMIELLKTATAPAAALFMAIAFALMVVPQASAGELCR